MSNANACRKRKPDVKFVGIMQYDGDLHLPANYLVPPPVISQVSGEYLCASGIRTFACSETQKFGHVTFFWNGNRSGYFDSNLETFVEVRCPLRPADIRSRTIPVATARLVCSQFEANGYVHVLQATGA